MKTDTPAVFDPEKVERHSIGWNTCTDESIASEVVNADEFDRTLALLVEAREQNRRKSGIIRHWQQFSADLGSVLGCGSIDNDVKKAVAELRERQEKAVKFIDILLRATEVVSSNAVLVDMKSILEPKADGNKKEETR